MQTGHCRNTRRALAAWWALSIPSVAVGCSALEPHALLNVSSSPPGRMPVAEARSSDSALGGRIVARSDMPLSSHDAAGRTTFVFLSDALRELASADVALVVVREATFRVGAVTEAQLWTSVPEDPPLSRQRVSGASLRATVRRLLAAGTFDRMAVSGLRVHRKTGSMEAHGRPIQDRDFYWLAAPGLSLDSDDGERVDMGFSVHDALRRYLAERPFLRATSAGQVLAESLPSSVQCKDQLRR